MAKIKGSISLRQFVARLFAALLVATAVSWSIVRDGEFFWLSLFALICYWILFSLLFSIGAASERRLNQMLGFAVVISIVAPFVASLAQPRSESLVSFAWFGLSAIFIVASFTAALYRRREIANA